MSWKDISPGNKVAKAKAARFIKSKTDKMGIEIEFSFEEPSTSGYETLRWVGWLSDAALQRTMETLVDVLGFTGNEAYDHEGRLTDPKALDYEREIQLVVEMEEGQDENRQPNGKVYPKIKWVNKLGGSGFAACTPEVIKSGLAASGFKAAFLAAKQGLPPQQKQPANPAPAQGSLGTRAFAEQDIPF